MKSIYKYILEPECSIDMPFGAEILSVHEQRGSICLWALVDTSPQKVEETREFVIFGTGHNIDIPTANLNFVGTSILGGGALVFHVFEKI